MFGTRTRTVEEPAASTRSAVWSPAQLVAVVLGIASIVLGVFVLTRTGLDLGDVTEPKDTVLGFDHTPLLGLSEIGFGVLLFLSGMRPIAGRALMTLLGAAALGLGIVIVADFWPNRMQDWFGVKDRGGWVILGVGAVILVVSFVMPVFGGRQRAVRERVVTDDG